MQRQRSLLIFILAISCGTLVANLYYAQPIIEFIAKDLHISTQLSGLLTTLTQIGYGFGLFFLVPMADLFNSKKLIVLLMSIMMLALISMLFSTNGILFILLTMLLGIGACAAQILVPLTTKLVPIEETGKYVGKVMSGLLIGIMIARPLSIGITELFGWQMVFACSLCLLVVIFSLLVKYLPSYEVETKNLTYRSLIASMGHILTHTPPLQQRAFYHACLFATFSLYWTILPIMLRAAPLSFSNYEIALIGFVAIAGALLTPYIGKLADKGYIFSTTNFSMILVALSVLLLFFVRDHSWLSISLVIMSGLMIDIGISGNLAVGQKVIFSLRADIRNRLNGLFMTIFFLGGAFGSWIGSYSYYTLGTNAALFIAIAFPVIAFFTHILIEKNRM